MGQSDEVPSRDRLIIQADVRDVCSIRIPELVDSINLQPEGPTEAARAIRKKLKYGNVPRQIRALTVSSSLLVPRTGD